MTVDGFIAQIGGQVSLWVGGSIITVSDTAFVAKHSTISHAGRSNWPIRLALHVHLAIVVHKWRAPHRQRHQESVADKKHRLSHRYRRLSTPNT